LGAWNDGDLGWGRGGGAPPLFPPRGTPAEPATASTPASKSAAAMMRIMRGSSEGGSLGLGLVDATVLHLQVGQRLLVHLALLAGQDSGFLVHDLPAIGRRARQPVGGEPLGGDGPAIALARPDCLAVTAVGIEEPRTNLFVDRVPADALADV